LQKRFLAVKMSLYKMVCSLSRIPPEISEKALKSLITQIMTDYTDLEYTENK
jgi:hypothetical protein